MTEADTRVREAARLRVLNSLPRRHQDYFYAVVRRLCAKTTRRSESSPEVGELFSEVMAKLLGVARADWSVGEQADGEIAHVLTTHQDPKLDERVDWLLREIGGRRGVVHRGEDIRRGGGGGKWAGEGYPVDQLEDKHIDILRVDPVDPHHDDDVRQAWLGLVELGESVFRPEEDAALLLRLIAGDAAIRDGFGDRWPIAAIIKALNRSHPGRAWNDDRVENAKRRLTNWIERLRRDHGLDSTALMDLLARYARKTARNSQPVPAIGSDRPTGGARASQ